MEIKYLIGNAAKPISTYENECKYIIHIVNNLGCWGAGFVLSLSEEYPIVEQIYRDYELVNGKYELGTNIYCPFIEDTEVIHMIAQKGLRNYHNPIPLQYDALEACLKDLSEYLLKEKQYVKVTVHAPRIGCGLAGGDWVIVSALIEKYLCSNDIDVFIYDLPEKK